MPVKLDKPEIISQTKDHLEIVSFSVDVANTMLYIVYRLGHLDADGKFVQVGGLEQLDVPTADFLGILKANPDLYPTLKTILYDTLIQATGLTGVVQ